MSESCNTNQAKKAPLKDRVKTWQFWKPILFIFLGVVAGYAYYYFIGCAGGTCAITSNPYASMAFGGLFGYFLQNSPCRTC